MHRWINGILISIALLSSTANAEIYQWTDSYGTTHFVNNKDKVPAKYPITPFVFTGDNKWSVDKSDTKADNQARLEYLRKFNHREKVIVPAPTVVIEQYFRREKRHRSPRGH